MNIAPLDADEISRVLEAKIKNVSFGLEVDSEGEVVCVKDGVLHIYGLTDVQSNELIDLGNNLFALAMNLESHHVGAVVLGGYSHIQQGHRVKRTGKLLSVPVGRGLLGRVVDALGQPVDGKGALRDVQFDAVEKIAPGVIQRKSVSVPLQTGIKAIDSMVPVGRGQRELIIGDRKTGKTTLGVDTILNQKDSGVLCVYVAIGCKQSSLAEVVETLRAHDALKYTIVVAATASDYAPLQYLAPYSGCSMGEFFRDRGEDALVVYDDLSKHAVAYRQISLLLRRPPGREAFPGDIFYLHSRLLERAACVSESYVETITKNKVKGQSGSLTALPIIETQAGDLSAFVPTNVISITDGQIFLEADLFNSGVRPAVNTGLSVSRVGGAAQTSIIKSLSGGLRIGLAQYKEVEAFAQFSQDLDPETKAQLQHGKMMVEMLKQGVSSPMRVSEMACVLMAPNLGLVDVPVKRTSLFIQEMLTILRTEHGPLLTALDKNPSVDEPAVQELKEIIKKILKNETGGSK
ncbi:MAG: F0F1 ATP synthase subunit alpha [Pseudomonadota bacterium]|nr:F0F1 ATP synthase subunit alpha [Pseudomonadota bacterium]MEC8461187.1 F0F1 ATP synthase subunit alpha [Pseudomonadota bacterium]